MSPLNQKFGIFFVQTSPLCLDIRTYRSSDIRTLVVFQPAFLHGLVDHFRGTFHEAVLIRILDSKDEFSSPVACDQVSVQSGSKIAHVHVAGGRRSKSGAHFPRRDSCFHFFKPFRVFHAVFLLKICLSIHTI